jgi:hypothetical protein
MTSPTMDIGDERSAVMLRTVWLSDWLKNSGVYILDAPASEI